jgi:hypothetical protein
MKKEYETKEDIKNRVSNRRKLLKESGLIQVAIWISPEDKEKVKAFDKSYTIEGKKERRPPKKEG